MQMKLKANYQKIISIILCVFIIWAIAVPSVVSAHEDTTGQTANTGTIIEEFENGDYLEIADSEPDSHKISHCSTDDICSDDDGDIKLTVEGESFTKSKTAYYKNKDGVILWSVKIDGEFFFNGQKTKCTDHYCKAKSYGSSWNIESVYGNHRKNYAYATVTAVHKGNTSYKYTRTIMVASNKTAVKLKAGKRYKLPVLFSKKTTTFKSTNPSAVSVNKKGVVKALKKGNAKIKIKSKGRSCVYNVNATTSPAITINGNKFNKNTTYNVKKGDKLKISITGKVKSINNKYSSTNSRIAKINSKLSAKKIRITGIKKGTATVKLKVNNVKKFNIKVKVR